MPVPAIAAAASRAAGKFLKKGGAMPGPKEAEPEKEKTSLLSPEGVLMMGFGFFLDFLTGISALLILLFGVGLLFAKIVYFFGLAGTSIWVLSRGSTPTIFFKNQWKKLAFRAIPGIGDAIPGIWTWTIYSELRK